jgi:hypothetical protein
LELNKDNFLRNPKEDHYDVDQFEYIFPKFSSKDLKRIGQKHQNFEEDYECNSLMVSNPQIIATAATKRVAKTKTINETSPQPLIETSRSNDSSDSSDNSQTYIGYLKPKKTINSKSDISIDSDEKSNEEMKSSISNNSKMSIDSSNKDEQNQFLDDKEDKDKHIPENIIKKDGKYSTRKKNGENIYCDAADWMKRRILDNIKKHNPQNNKDKQTNSKKTIKRREEKRNRKVLEEFKGEKKTKDEEEKMLMIEQIINKKDNLTQNKPISREEPNQPELSNENENTENLDNNLEHQTNNNLEEQSGCEVITSFNANPNEFISHDEVSEEDDEVSKEGDEANKEDGGNDEEDGENDEEDEIASIFDIPDNNLEDHDVVSQTMVAPNEVENVYTKTTGSKCEEAKLEETNQEHEANHSLNNFAHTKPLNIITINNAPAVGPVHHIMDSNKSNE